MNTNREIIDDVVDRHFATADLSYWLGRSPDSSRRATSQTSMLVMLIYAPVMLGRWKQVDETLRGIVTWIHRDIMDIHSRRGIMDSIEMPTPPSDSDLAIFSSKLTGWIKFAKTGSSTAKKGVSVTAIGVTIGKKAFDAVLGSALAPLYMLFAKRLISAIQLSIAKFFQSYYDPGSHSSDVERPVLVGQPHFEMHHRML